MQAAHDESRGEMAEGSAEKQHKEGRKDQRTRSHIWVNNKHVNIL